MKYNQIHQLLLIGTEKLQTTIYMLFAEIPLTVITKYCTMCNLYLPKRFHKRSRTFRFSKMSKQTGTEIVLTKLILVVTHLLLPITSCFSIDEKECETGIHNCHYDANCTNTKGSFHCACLDGYAGNGISCLGKSLV